MVSGYEIGAALALTAALVIGAALVQNNIEMVVGLAADYLSYGCTVVILVWSSFRFITNVQNIELNAQAVNPLRQLTLTSARSKIVFDLLFYIPVFLAPLSLIDFCFSPSTASSTFSVSAILSMVLGLGLAAFFGGVQGVSGLFARSKRAQSNKQFGIMDRINTVAPFLIHAILLYILQLNGVYRKALGEIKADDPDASTKILSLKGQSTLGFLYTDEKIGSVVLSFAIALYLFSTNAVGTMRTARSILAQAIRSTTFSAPVQILPALAEITALVCWQTQSASLIRQRLVAGEWPIPVAVMMTWCALHASRCNEASERTKLVSPLNYVAKKCGLQSTSSSRNHVASCYFEPYLIRFMREGLVSPALLGVSWDLAVWESLNETLSNAFFGGRRNSTIETAARGSCTISMWPEVAQAMAPLGTCCDTGGGLVAPAAGTDLIGSQFLNRAFKVSATATSPQEAAQMFGNIHSFVTRQMYNNVAILVQGVLSLASAVVANDISINTLIVYDGAGFSRPTAQQIANSWAGRLLATPQATITVASISVDQCNVGLGLTTDPLFQAWCALAVKTYAFGPVPTNLLAPDVLVPGEIYAYASPQLLTAEATAAGFDNRQGAVFTAPIPSAFAAINATSRFKNMGLLLV